MSTDRLAGWRSEHVGIVFQDFHLLPTLTGVENIELAIEQGLPAHAVASVAVLYATPSPQSDCRLIPASCPPK